MGESGDLIALPRVRLDVGLERFEAVFRRRGRAAATIRTYGWALRYLIEFLEVRSVTCFDEVRATHLEAWQDQLIDRELTPKTRSIYATAARQFLGWAADEDLVDFRLIRALQVVHTQRRRPRPIPLSDLERIQAHIGPLRQRMTERQLRDRALFSVLLVSGARISEALQLRRGHFAAERTIVVRQKGGTEKELFLTPTARQRVLDYLRIRRDRSDFLWVSSGRTVSKQLLSREMIGRIWTTLAKEIGVPRWTSHQLRHTCATELHRAHLSDVAIAEHLGHHDLGTLPNYAAVVDEHRERKLEVLEGLLSRGLDMKAPDGVAFRRPAALRRSRPDNRIRKRRG